MNAVMLILSVSTSPPASSRSSNSEQGMHLHLARGAPQLGQAEDDGSSVGLLVLAGARGLLLAPIDEIDDLGKEGEDESQHGAERDARRLRWLVQQHHTPRSGLQQT